MRARTPAAIHTRDQRRRETRRKTGSRERYKAARTPEPSPLPDSSLACGTDAKVRCTAVGWQNKAGIPQNAPDCWHGPEAKRSAGPEPLYPAQEGGHGLPPAIWTALP